MGNRKVLIPLALFAAMGLVACENNENGQQTTADQDEADQQTQMAAEQDPSQGQVADTGQMADSSGQAQSTQQQGQIALTLQQSPEHGEYVADDQGRALYVLETDSQGESNCYGECAEQWPPLIAQGNGVTAEDPSIEESELETVRREDGREQVAYNGRPLYYYVEDRGPGEASGQDVHDEWGGWYLLTAEGEPLETEQQASQARGGQ